MKNYIMETLRKAVGDGEVVDFVKFDGKFSTIQKLREWGLSIFSQYNDDIGLIEHFHCDVRLENGDIFQKYGSGKVDMMREICE